jgi:uncharacterized membrane protein YfcA
VDYLLVCCVALLASGLTLFSGFGLGALHSAFLIRAGLSKQGYIGTGVALACLVDLTRLPVYAGHFTAAGSKPGLVAAAILCAWAGAFFGARMLHKVTDAFVQRIVSGLLVLAGLLIAGGAV